ncbi:MAG: homocysteine S-methyltransferase family protein [Phycisphaerae bacterium]
MRDALLDAAGRRVVVGDGAMGTQLIDAGLAVGASADEWNLTHPDRVRAIQTAYVDAGAEILLTNTFGANPLALGRHGLSDQAYAINLAAARMARDCAGPAAYVLGDIGPFGGFLEPLGNTTPRALEDAIVVQATGLLDGGADGIIVETMTSLEELAVVCRAVRRCRPHTTLVGSVAFDRVADGGFRTMTGATVEDTVECMAAAEIDVAGCNCGTGIHVGDYVQLVAEFRRLTDRPIMVQPNAGQPRLDRGRITYDETAETMAAAVPALIDAGASIVGGCCGTTPEHIRLFRRQVDRLTPRAAR